MPHSDWLDDDRNLLKTGVIFGMNSLALSWAQMLALPPVTLAWIAATALERDLPLATNNAAHYTGVEGLTVVAETAQPK